MASITYDSWSDQLSTDIQAQFKESLDVLKWAYKEYKDEIVYACSFGAEGMVLIDLINKVNKTAKIVFLDTDVHFKETYELIDKVKEKYPTLQIMLQKPELTLKEQAEQHGDELWKTNPNQCCNIRKILPLQKALKGNLAWISGLRREQSQSRSHTNFINKDDKFQSIKICPLIHWSWEDIWNYIRFFNLPYNRLHDQGYPSIGCEYCTLPTGDDKDSRSGRWANSSKTECGLHQSG
ncbi:phosphoadenylyl-sulfate reductase [Cytobacillus sp. IB215665]|uniref:phosphoadenylyl-sulfate reductase n=1 Tax=Cytobacillus sp. IB215665 TaxID=3097357 RepID=UPI002A0EF753|nr:phosphoadenylyl-sulfate reductase [Cytobacillus sp. IB215665]MDX8365818.1 phosphoadenylyl-sulfate reductase [Cytobacillus sp. IB215665]